MSNTYAESASNSAPTINGQSDHPFGPARQDSLEVPIQEVAGGRVSTQESGGCQTNDHLVENIDEILEAIELLRNVAGDDEEILETESLYKWFTEAARVHFEQKDAEEAEERLSYTDTERGVSFEGNERLDNWLEDVFVQELAAKIQSRIFVGGADEAADVSMPTPCPYCNRAVGDETDQHVLKCKYAHEEQERLDWTMRRNGELRRRKGV